VVTSWTTSSDLRRAAVIVGALAVVGVPGGLAWQLISSHAVGYVVSANLIMPDETETFISSDGRFVLLTCAIGAVAAALVWLAPAWRGPTSVAALAVGGVAGSLVASWIGATTGGGTATGAVDTLVRLPIALHARGLLFAQSIVSVAIIGVLSLTARSDDLNSGSARSEAPVAEPEPSASAATA
jgi:Protein of unknown function (DUF2567)